MIFFSIVEIINKTVGLIMHASISRYLGVDEFVSYSALLVIFGYCLELSFFSYQKRNLVDASRDSQIIYKDLFFLRQRIVFLAGLVSILTFFMIVNDEVFSLWPLMLILIFPILTFDFLLFAGGKSKYVVVARAIAQMLAFLLVGGFYLLEIDSKYIFYVNLLQSVVLSVVIMWAVQSKLGVNIGLLFKRSISASYSILEYNQETKRQFVVFLASISVILVASCEILLMEMFVDEQDDAYVIGNRIVLILLPFIHYYINASVKKVTVETYLKYMLVIFFCVIALNIFSPAIVLLMFGEKYYEIGFGFNSYLVLVIVQGYVGFVFMLALKDGSQFNLALKYLMLIFLVSIIYASFGHQIVEFGEIFLSIFLFKVICIVMLPGNIPAFYRLITVLSISLCVGFTYILIEVGYYDWVSRLLSNGLAVLV